MTVVASVAVRCMAAHLVALGQHSQDQRSGHGLTGALLSGSQGSSQGVGQGCDGVRGLALCQAPTAVAGFLSCGWIDMLISRR